MPLYENVITKQQDFSLSTNKVLRNTYLLLGFTLIFSSITATWSLFNHSTPLNPLFTILIYFGLLTATNLLKNSAWGLVAIFALTGFLGYTLGPILNFYITNFNNGSQIIMTALGSTGTIFILLSVYAIISKKDFSYLAGFLFVGITVAFLSSLLLLFFNMPILQLLISGAFVLLSSGLILFQTSQIINGGERNYILATITLYVALFNLFINLLNILAAFGGRR
jgi:modulator of FtsH protease